ncbi:hypothetical protein [Acetobacterium sp.]|uniref:hypothetical protein n=1 Tax=Acetobacterium sp. TaxID=1872094 RepID=UPI0035944114
MARIEPVLRRYGNKREVTQFEDLAINTAERSVKKNGTAIEMTIKEYKLMLLLIKKPSTKVV